MYVIKNNYGSHRCVTIDNNTLMTGIGTLLYTFNRIRGKQWIDSETNICGVFFFLKCVCKTFLKHKICHANDKYRLVSRI